MSLIRNLHVLLAYVTVAGFVARAALAFLDAPARHHKLVRILPHVVDTLLLVCGLALVFGLGHSFSESWLSAKLVALLAYIGFGVLTLRANTPALRVAGVAGALASVGYIFMVALARDPLPVR